MDLKSVIVEYGNNLYALAPLLNNVFFPQGGIFDFQKCCFLALLVLNVDYLVLHWSMHGQASGFS